jgi:hypothetical protein
MQGLGITLLLLIGRIAVLGALWVGICYALWVAGVLAKRRLSSSSSAYKRLR